MSRYTTKKLIQALGGRVIPTVIETGIFLTETTRQLADIFQEVHGIELSEELYREGLVKTAPRPNIHLHLGDSSVILPGLIERIENPIVFYLDAHYFPDVQQFGIAEDSFPLWQELAAIKLRLQPDVVIVDDVHAFGRTGELADKWASVCEGAICERLSMETIQESKILDDWCVVWRKDRR